MCGIAGFTTFGPAPRDAGSIIQAQTDALQHRGPDDQGAYSDASIRLGFRRLAIIDPPGGHQPMLDASERYCLVYNGELYNYIELQRRLERDGHRFRTQSDTEVVLELLARYGVTALTDFDGIFALALWDRREHRLLLARDRFGIKPLYYGRIGPDVVFASELKALMKHPSLRRTLNPASISKYFSYGYIPAPHTIFEGIHKLEPGTWLQAASDSVGIKSYWQLPLHDRPVSPSLGECGPEVLRLLRDAVRRQLRSDVPVGVLLSGGIDSSTITALAAQESTRQIHSFSIGFDQPSYDESVHARAVAAQFGTEHHEVIFTLRQAAELFTEVMRHTDEPFADASMLPTFLLCRLASKTVKVVLGGDGGDELFAGYPSFQAHRVVERLSFLPIGWRDRLGNATRRLPVSHHYKSVGFLLQQFQKGLGLSPEVRFLLWMGSCSSTDKQQLFSAAFAEKLRGHNPFEDILRHIEQSRLTDPFQRLQFLCARMYFQDDILTKVDRAGMAHSLEVRVPFTDNALVEYACRIQPQYKLHGLTTKYVLKRAVRGLLPDHIINRRKAGFMMPVAQWLSEQMRDTVEDLCSPTRIAATGIFDADGVRRMLDEHFERRRDHRKPIYTLLCFMAWLRHHHSP